MHINEGGQPFYPAILAPDRSIGHNDAVPVAVITVEGYVGSAWSALATKFAPMVTRAFRRDSGGSRTLYVTTVRAFPTHLEVWIPLLESRYSTDHAESP